jgi:hypothetical protein
MSGYVKLPITSGSGGDVTSVNGETGVVVLTAAEVGADAAGTAQALFDTLGDKYVRTTRFENIGSGTSGTVTLPSDSEIVLDDFGGTTDAVVAQVSGGKPTLQSAKTSTGEIITTSFNSLGEWSFTGTPSSYPVAILYRIRQKLSDFDSTASDIFGSANVEQVTKIDIRLGNVDNTSDLDKPISTNTQTALDTKQDTLVAISQNIENGLDQSNTVGTEDYSGAKSLNSIQLNVNPTEDSPNEFRVLKSNVINVDLDNEGFDIGSNGSGISFESNNLSHLGSSDTGTIEFTRNYLNVGNGTDPVTVKGLAYYFGFGNINANVTIDGPIQGYGFQPNVDENAILNSNSYVNAFYDYSNINTACNSYQSFACGPSIAQINNNNGYSGFNNNANIDIFEGNASYTGISVNPNLGTFDTGNFTGIRVNPIITSGGDFSTGLNINMSNCPGTGIKAIDATGDVNINGALSFSGALSIGALNAFASQTLVDGGGNPSSIHLLISNPSVADNVTVANADIIGVNTAGLIQIGENSQVTTAFLGVSALGLPAVVTLGSGATVDRVNGAVFAISLDVTAGGGTINEVSLCNALGLPNGITTVNKLYGYRMDLPFGSIGIEQYGVYIVPDIANYFAGSVLVGDDTATNSSVGIEINSTSKALLNARMTTTERNALVAVNGMQIYNTTNSRFEFYENGAWVYYSANAA